MEESLDTVRDVPDIVARLAVQYGPQVLAALLILMVGFFVARWAGTFGARSLRHFQLEPPVRTSSAVPFTRSSCASAPSSIMSRRL